MPLDRFLYKALTGKPGVFRFRAASEGPLLPALTDLGGSIGIYIHIPFCRSLCPFCPYTKALYEPSLAVRYHTCLEREIDEIVAGLGASKVTSIYFGGGTPLTQTGLVETAVGRLKGLLPSASQVAVEVHPRDVAADTVARLSDAGVNMVSLGVQSLNDDVLNYLGRDHDAALALEAVDTLVKSGNLSVNVDLITGIPGQTIDSCVSDMLCLFSRGADQVSAYPLMDFSFTTLKSRYSFGEQHRLLDALSEAGDLAGCRRTSVWTWTRPGSEVYSSITRDDYVGLGVGAASKVGSRFWLNTFSLEAYLQAHENKKSAVALELTMTDEEQALYWLFWRCYLGKFDLESDEAASIPNLERLAYLGEGLGLLKLKAAQVHLTNRGLFLYHLLERYYTRKYIGRLWQTCREAPFPGSISL